jgi:hypothetical protein
VKRISIFYTLAIPGFLLGSSCFTPRPAAPPQTSVPSTWISPTEYSILLSNLSGAISRNNVQDYLRCLQKDNFKFSPATVVYTGNQLIWNIWSWNSERDYYENVITQLGITTGNQLTFTLQQLQFLNNDTLKYIGNYDLQINHLDTSLTKKFKGQAELIMGLNGFNEWEIVSWTDFETTPDSSWSRLKLKFSQ